jgi:hypothetical protein
MSADILLGSEPVLLFIAILTTAAFIQLISPLSYPIA